LPERTFTRPVHFMLLYSEIRSILLHHALCRIRICSRSILTPAPSLFPAPLAACRRIRPSSFAIIRQSSAYLGRFSMAASLSCQAFSSPFSSGCTRSCGCFGMFWPLIPPLHVFSICPMAPGPFLAAHLPACCPPWVLIDPLSTSSPL